MMPPDVNCVTSEQYIGDTPWPFRKKFQPLPKSHSENAATWMRA
jgi:hypothetical protein